MLFNPSDLATPEPDDKPDDKLKRPRPSAALSDETKAERTVLASRISKKYLTDLIPDMPDGATIHLISAGLWNNFDLLHHLAAFYPGADLWLATWGISEPGARGVHRMLDDGLIRSVRAVVDTHSATYNSEAMAYLSGLCVKLGTFPCHAKVYVLRTASRGMSVVCSQNLTTNPRIEAGVICDSVAAADFHIDWIGRVLDFAPPFSDHVQLLKKARRYDTDQRPDSD